MMTGRPPRSTAAAELEVPRSIPMMAMTLSLFFSYQFAQYYV
jgi:hypothetical protein